MGRVSTYLNFMGNTAEAFDFYRSVFGTDYLRPISYMGDMPGGGPELSEAEKAMVMHVELPIYAGHVLMATDMLESMGHQLRVGNNSTIHLETDSRSEADRFYAALSANGSDLSPLQDMPWGQYWGTCLDRFGVRWMLSCLD